ncbi:MAG: alpha/beta hydrolase [Bacilli bacterium]|nr:alpha/beta hydrolase [Bacilli bacterium]
MQGRIIYGLSILVFLLLLTGCQDPLQPGNLLPELVTDDNSLPFLEINNTRLHLETWGSPGNPVIIVLHGGPGNDYRDLLSLVQEVNGYSLADDYFLVFFDQRGSGLSQRHDQSMLSLDLYLEDLECLIDYYSPAKQVVLLGHSWGGQYAAMYANEHPERIAGLILAEPGEFSSELGTHIGGDGRNIFSESISDFLWIRQFISSDDHLKSDYSLGIILADPDWNKSRRDHYSNNWRVGAAVLKYIYLKQLQSESFDFTSRLSEIEANVLFLVGEYSEEMGEEFQTNYQMEFFQSADIIVIPDSGHSDIVGYHAEFSIPHIVTYLENLNLED